MVAVAQADFAWSKGRRPPGAVLYSSREPSELLQWLCHDDNTINIFLVIISINLLLLLLLLLLSPIMDRKCPVA